MHGPQADSRILAPALIISESAPFKASILSTCFDPGAMQSEAVGAIVLHLRISASDEITLAFLKAQGRENDWTEILPDADAEYDEIIDIDLCSLVPMAACPHMPDQVKTTDEIEYNMYHRPWQQQHQVRLHPLQAFRYRRLSACGCLNR